MTEQNRNQNRNVNQDRNPDSAFTRKTNEPSRSGSQSDGIHHRRLTKQVAFYVGAIALITMAIPTYAIEAIAIDNHSATESSQDPLSRLIGQLADPDPVIREESARMLGSMFDVRATESLIIALQDEVKPVRIAAIQALGKTGDMRAADPLLALFNEQDSDESIAIAQTLAQLGDPRTAGILVAMLRNENASVRKTAAELAGEFENRQLTDALLKALDDSFDGVRYSAARALGIMGDRCATEPICRMLQDKTTFIRKGAATALTSLADPESVDSLILALKDPNSVVRDRAAEALGRIGDPRTVEPLLERWRDTNEKTDVRIEAIRSLGRIGDIQTLQAIQADQTKTNSEFKESQVQIIDAVRQDIQLGAWRAWHDQGEAQALGIALKALDGGNTGQCLAALRILTEIGTDSALSGVIQATAHTDRDVRIEAIRMLRYSPSDQGDDALAAILKDPDEEIQWLAASTLACHKDPRAIPLLCETLNHKDNLRVRRAAEYLGDLGDPCAVKPLCALLNNDDRRVRKEAAESLAKLADSNALDALVSTAKRGEYAKGYVLDALGRINAPKSVSTLVHALTLEDTSMNRRAARALARLGWHPETEEQRVRYLVASGQTENDNANIPRAVPVEQATDNSFCTAKGPFLLNQPIQTPMVLGIGEKYQKTISLRQVEFRIKDEKLMATLHMVTCSWPPSTWRIRIEVQDEASKALASAEHSHKTPGFIISMPSWGPVAPIHFEFNDVITPQSIKYFTVMAELVSAEES